MVYNVLILSLHDLSVVTAYLKIYLSKLSFYSVNIQMETILPDCTICNVLKWIFCSNRVWKTVEFELFYRSDNVPLQGR